MRNVMLVQDTLVADSFTCHASLPYMHSVTNIENGAFISHIVNFEWRFHLLHCNFEWRFH